MDPLHITEFASDRYFEKLNQIRDAQAVPSGSSTQQQDGNALEVSTPQAPFYLPIREARVVANDEVVLAKSPDQKGKERSRLFSFRSRILHSKPQPSSTTEQVDRRPSVAESTKQRYVSYSTCDGASSCRCVPRQRFRADAMIVYHSTNYSSICQLNCRYKYYAHYHYLIF